MKRNLITGSGLLILAALFIAVTVLSNALFRGVKLDLTENNMYTLSEGSKNIVGQLEEPINLYFFFSEKTAASMPSVKTYANHVREMLEQLAELSGGKINLSVIDPEPFSEAEDRAAQFGLQAAPVSGESIYLGLAGTNSVDGQEVIPFFAQDRQTFLEYDLVKLVHNLAHPKKKVVGLVTALPMAGSFDQMMGQPQNPWMIHQSVTQLFDVRALGTDRDKIDDDVDVLWIVHPKNLPEKMLFAIDQFVLKGGKALVFVDPNAEADRPDPQQGQFAPPSKSSNLETLFKAWGIEVNSGKFIGDRSNGVEIGTRSGERETHIGYLRLTGDEINAQDTITSNLQQLTIGTGGGIKAVSGATTQLTPLLTSSQEAAELDASQLEAMSSPRELLAGFKPAGQRFNFAARITGKVKTAFPNGPAAASEQKPEDLEKIKKDMLQESKADINVVVVADVDMLGDPFWVRVQNFFGQQIAAPFASNGDFVGNALDNLVGSNDLIGIRGRTGTSRPFDKVAELRSKAEQSFREREKELQKTLEETEQKLNEMQAAKQDSGNKMILSPEQEQTLIEFQDKKVEVRKQLREVRHELDKDIESLGALLKKINILLMPIVLCVIAIGVAYVRAQRRVRA
jgi:ABC-type uncharacterized transport system involved in gliding motility auxiliary subunit